MTAVGSLRTGSLVAAVGCALMLAPPVLAQPQTAAPVDVTRVIQREVISGQQFVGTVTPQRRSVVESAVDGRVMTMHVDDGDPVNMIEVAESADEEGRIVGQPLVMLRTKNMEIQIAAAEADLDLRKQELTELERSLPEQLNQAQATLEESQALLQYAESRHNRMESASRAGTVTPEQLEEVVSRLLAARQIHTRAKSSAALLSQTRDAKLAQARFKVQSQQEEVNRLRDILDKYTIRAPFAGYVVATHTEVGEWIKQGDPVAEIIELDPIEVIVAVPEQYIAALQEGLDAAAAAQQKLNANIQVNGLPGKLFVGQVVRIVPQADLRSRSFPVRIRVPNPPGKNGHPLKAGMLAQVALAVGRQQSSLLVPKDALVLGGTSVAVFVVAQQGEATVARLAPVQIGAAVGSLIEIRGDVQANDQVVVVGNERLRPGQAIRVAKEIPAE